MERGVHGRFLDPSTSVREAAIELVGKFILVRPELIPQYYNMLSERILVCTAPNKPVVRVCMKGKIVSVLSSLVLILVTLWCLKTSIIIIYVFTGHGYQCKKACDQDIP